MTDEARTTLEIALPAYEIEGKLGQGAFGVVYEARHTQLGRQVAIKQLPPSFAEDDEVRERFIAEAKMVASLDHPHIVPVYDFVESEGARFLIMERCQGSVGDRFKEEGIVTDEACAAVLACLAALDFAHGKGLLHRDVKPENLMYDSKGVVKLGDFGIARDLGVETRRTATGMIVGTPAYMSPEQCRGDDLTPASDVYSVAMMAYELMTGSLPFPESPNVNGLLAHHLVTQPTPLLTTRPELPGAVGEVIDRALAKDLDVRYGTALEFATALARACVTAFGSGWLRRRRFVLHWPEIIAETERPSDNSPRTGTIMVRAGDVTHQYVTPEDAVVEPTAQMQPQPVASVDPITESSAPTRPSTPPPAEPTASAPQATAPAQPPSDATTGAVPATADRNGPNWVLFGGIAAVIAAVVIGVIAFTGGSNESGLTVADTPPATAVGSGAAQGTDDAVDDPAEAPDDDGATGEAAEPATQPTEVPAPTVAEETATPEPAATPTPFVVLLTERPAGIDLRDASSPFAPTPCPEDQERVACIYAGVAVDEETGEMTVPYFVEGFIPQLEPIEHHIHFYLDTVVDGDETRVGTETPGGTWREWDAPFPATSFGGENGRTLYTLADYEATDARMLCVLVADEEHRAIPGSGNCSPLLRLNDTEAVLAQLNRLTGTFIGSCGVGVTAIVPEDWRWVDLVATPIEEAARRIRPTNVDATESLLEELIDSGGVVWADGPVVDEFVVNLSISIYPGEFALTDGPDEVRTTLNGLGITTRGAQVRTLPDGRDVLTNRTNNPNSVSSTYVVPDHGYAMVMTFTAPGGAGLSELADSIAATMVGC